MYNDKGLVTTRTSEEMDGTLPRIAFFEKHPGLDGPMGVDFLDHELL